MPILSDRRYEDFAQRLANGEDRTEAYKSAGFDGQRANARRASNYPQVKARVAELGARACELADITRASTLVEVDRVARANITDFFEAVEVRKGKQVEIEYRLRDLTKLPRALTAAISAIEWNRDGMPKIVLHPKVSALDKLGRNLGLWQGDVQANLLGVVTLDDLVSASYRAKQAAREEARTIEGEVVS